MLVAGTLQCEVQEVHHHAWFGQKSRLPPAKVARLLQNGGRNRLENAIMNRKL